MGPRCATVFELCLAVVWVVRMAWRCLRPCGLLLDPRGNYTELIKKKKKKKSMWQMSKTNISHGVV